MKKIIECINQEITTWKDKIMNFKINILARFHDVSINIKMLTSLLLFDSHRQFFKHLTQWNKTKFLACEWKIMVMMITIAWSEQEERENVMLIKKIALWMDDEAWKMKCCNITGEFFFHIKLFLACANPHHEYLLTRVYHHFPDIHFRN